MCIETDSVHDKFTILNNVIITAENLFATEYNPFAATFRNQDIIVLSETLIIHHDN